MWRSGIGETTQGAGGGIGDELLGMVTRGGVSLLLPRLPQIGDTPPGPVGGVEPVLLAADGAGGAPGVAPCPPQRVKFHDGQGKLGPSFAKIDG